MLRHYCHSLFPHKNQVALHCKVAPCLFSPVLSCSAHHLLNNSQQCLANGLASTPGSATVEEKVLPCTKLPLSASHKGKKKSKNNHQQMVPLILRQLSMHTIQHDLLNRFYPSQTLHPLSRWHSAHSKR